MKVYKTNSGLGYNEYAYFVKNKVERDYNPDHNEYICIGMNCRTDVYFVGGCDVLQDYEVEETNLKTSEFSICNTYLFNFWAANSIKL